jgi:hypothetical protein
MALVPVLAVQAQITTQKITPLPTTTQTQMQTLMVLPQCTVTSKSHINGLYVLPRQAANPVAGQGVEIYLDFTNDCNIAMNIPWRIDRSGVTIASGVASSVPAGQLTEAKFIWSATVGTHDFAGYVDPSNTLGDTGPDRSVRTIKWQTAYTVYAVPQWNDWANTAKTGAQNGIRAAIAQATVKGDVNAAYGRIQRGGVDGGIGYIMGPVYGAMSTAPDAVKMAFVNALKDAWNSWAVNFEMQTVGLLSWPIFLAYPANPAPPTLAAVPSVGVRFGTSSGESALSATTLATAMKSRMPAFEGSYPGADAAISSVAQFVSDKFSAWKNAATVCMILGSGPVPSMGLIPPVPGPVQGGTIQAKLCGDF